MVTISKMHPMLKGFNCYLFIFTLLLSINSVFAQKSKTSELREKYHEEADDPYVAVSRESMPKGPAYKATTSTYFTRQVNVDENGDNIIGDAGNETSIAIDPTNPNRIVIGWRQFDTVTSNFRQAGNAYSTDGGLTWTFPGVLDPGVFRSDPVLDFDAQGNFYYNSLKETFECDVYKITDGGEDWGAPFPAKGGDKQWMVVDRSGGIGDGNNYSYWNSSFSTCSGNFTRSTDGSNTFEDCIFVDQDPFWGTLAVDAEGNLYLTGNSNIGLAVIKSTTAKDPESNISWDSANTVDLDGQLGRSTPVNPEGLMGQAWVNVDISDGPGRGNVYVLASVERFSNSDPGDVMFAKSTDGGISFSPPVRINTDSGTNAYQWFGTMSVAPNGRIDAVWLDTRDASNGIDSVLYYSFSVDQGETWSENEALSEQFNPSIGYPQQNKMGDYFHMVSDNEYAHLAWANTLNGGEDVYYTQITPSIPLGSNDFGITDSFNFKSYPNPFTDQTTLEFYVASEEKITVEVFDIQGRKLNTLFDGYAQGNHRISWNGTNTAGVKLSTGLYFITIKSASKRGNSKILLQ